MFTTELPVMVWLRKAYMGMTKQESQCVESHVMTPYVRHNYISVSLWATPNTTNPQRVQNTRVTSSSEPCTCRSLDMHPPLSKESLMTFGTHLETLRLPSGPVQPPESGPVEPGTGQSRP